MTPTLSSLRLPSQSPRRLYEALRILGMPLTLREVRALDRDYLLHDVKLVFKEKIKSVHPDHGGDPAHARIVVEAYKVVRRICHPRLYIPQARPKVSKPRVPVTKEVLHERSKKGHVTRKLNKVSRL